MSSNTIGKLFSLTTFGESHGVALGGVIDGCPAGLEIDLDFIQSELDRRKPGQSKIVSQRKEGDKVEFLSGICVQADCPGEGKTTGAPIGFIIRNENQKSQDYNHLKGVYRPSHADYTYDKKYGVHEYRGGGRASARATISSVVGGAVAKLFLKKYGIIISAFTSQVGEIKLLKDYHTLDLSKTETNAIRCPDAWIAETMIKKIEQVRKEGDTLGGVITCIAQNIPAGLGEPVFDKLHADLGKAMLGINAVKGFEIGSGFDGVKRRGSEHNDLFYTAKNKGGEASVKIKTNFSGGIQGGISNGEDIYFRVAFKPVSTIMKEQTTVNSKLETVNLKGKGRHDPCVLPRAVVIVEAMTALVLADHLLRNKTTKL